MASSLGQVRASLQLQRDRELINAAADYHGETFEPNYKRYVAQAERRWAEMRRAKKLAPQADESR